MTDRQPDGPTDRSTKISLYLTLSISMSMYLSINISIETFSLTGGASSDFQTATNIAVWMVKELGMSEKIGLRVVKEVGIVKEVDIISVLGTYCH